VLRQQALLGPLVLGDVLHRAEHAARPARLVPEHIALAADEPHLAVGPDRAVFHRVPRSAPERRGHGGRPVLTIGRVEERLHVRKAQGALLRRQPEDAVRFVRPGVAIGLEITLPVADVRDALGASSRRSLSPRLRNIRTLVSASSSRRPISWKSRSSCGVQARAYEH